MPVNKKAATSKKELKKQKVNEISALLTPALSKFKKVLGEKKFEKRIRKVAKLFADDLSAKASAKPAKASVVSKAKKG